MNEPAGYSRQLRVFDATMLTVGGIIGGGIFLNPAVVAQRVHTAPLIVGTWVLGGVIAVMGALCFAELGGRLPEAGGGYVYLKDAFGPLPAFLYGWTFLVIVNTGGMSAVAVTFARYTTDLLHVGDVWVRPVAIGSIIVLTAVNYIGIRAGATTQNIFTVLKLAALAAVIAVGIAAAAAVVAHGTSALAWAGDRAATPVGAGDLVRVVGVALIPVLFTYGGWAHANNVGGEMRDAERTLPRAMTYGIAIVVAVYVLVEHCVRAGPGPGRAGGEYRAGVGHDAAGVGFGGRDGDRAGCGGIDVRVCEPGDPVGAADSPGDGGGRAVFPAGGDPPSAVPDPDGGAAGAGGVGGGAHGIGHVWAAS